MSRNLSVTFIETVQALSTGDAAIFLLTISHPTFAETIRICNNRTDMTSRGNLFQALAFDISLAVDDAKTLPAMTMTLDNVDRSLIREIRELPDAPEFLMELILASNPDQVELAFPAMTVGAITYDASTIRTNVIVSDTLNLKYPRGTATPASNPGLF